MAAAARIITVRSSAKSSVSGRSWTSCSAIPTEFRPNRIRIALDQRQFELYRRALDNGAHEGFRSDVLDPGQVRELVPLAGDNVFGGYFHHFGGHANPHRTMQAYAWAMRDRGGRLLQHTRALGFDMRGTV